MTDNNLSSELEADAAEEGWLRLQPSSEVPSLPAGGFALWDFNSCGVNTWRDNAVKVDLAASLGT